MRNNAERIKVIAPRIIAALEEIDGELASQWLDTLETVYRTLDERESVKTQDGAVGVRWCAGLTMWTMRNEVRRLQDKLSRLEDEISNQLHKETA